MITDVNDYFTQGCGRCARFGTADCSVQHWAEGLAHLRAICRDLDLVETVKWGHPCYMFADRNIAIFGAFRSNFRLSFMNAGLLADPDGVLRPGGPNARAKSVLIFDSLDMLRAQDSIIRAFLTDLKVCATKGITPPKTAPGDLDLPRELIDALDSDPDYADAFAALTPGRQRSWFLHINSAKQAATRIKRIEKARDRVLISKGWNER